MNKGKPKLRTTATNNASRDAWSIDTPADVGDVPEPVLVPLGAVLAAVFVALEPVVAGTAGFVARTVTPATADVAAGTYVVDGKLHCDMILFISKIQVFIN